MNRTAYRLIVLLLCLIGWQMSLSACCSMTDTTVTHSEKATIDRTTDKGPLWEDLGMENVLVVGSQPTVTAPTSMRLSQDHGSPLGRVIAAGHRLQRPVSERSALPHRAQPGYIYCLVCLRL